MAHTPEPMPARRLLNKARDNLTNGPHITRALAVILAADHAADNEQPMWQTLENAQGSVLLLSTLCQPVHRITASNGSIVNVYAQQDEHEPDQ